MYILVFAHSYVLRNSPPHCLCPFDSCERIKNDSVGFSSFYTVAYELSKPAPLYCFVCASIQNLFVNVLSKSKSFIWVYSYNAIELNKFIDSIDWIRFVYISEYSVTLNWPQFSIRVSLIEVWSLALIKSPKGQINSGKKSVDWEKPSQ